MRYPDGRGPLNCRSNERGPLNYRNNKRDESCATGDVAAFVDEHLQASLRGAGLNLVEGAADIDISGEIRQFFVTEVNTYNGEVSLLIHIKNSAGKELWSGTVTGEAGHFGRSYRADNYYETLSDMVLSTAHNLLNTPGFRDAVLSH